MIMAYQEFEGTRKIDSFLFHDQLMALETYNNDEIFRFADAQAWIDAFKVTDEDGALDIERTAALVGVPVVYSSLEDEGHAAAAVTGLYDDDEPVVVHISNVRSGNHQRHSFGHELAHIFLYTAVGVRTTGRHLLVENFCDFFGAQIALPLSELGFIDMVDPGVIAALCEKFKIDPELVITQLMLAKKLPTRIQADTELGEVPNAVYSGKVQRHEICLYCTYNEPHEKHSVYDEALLFDCRAYGWTNLPSPSHGGRDRIDFHRQLNIQYGRWTDADEAKVEDERERGRKLWEALSKHIGNLDQNDF